MTSRRTDSEGDQPVLDLVAESVRLPTSAVVLTVGDELVEGDTANRNATWLARRLQNRGLRLRMVVTVRDDVGDIARLVKLVREDADLVFVVGGLGGTPDDVTRRGIAAAYGVELNRDPWLEETIRRTCTWWNPEFALRGSLLPTGARPLPNPLGGTYGFVIGQTYVLPGAPEEVRAIFRAIEPELTGHPRWSRQLKWSTTEDRIADILDAFSSMHPLVGLGSYPSQGSREPELRLVLKSVDATALSIAYDWLRTMIEGSVGPPKLAYVEVASKLRESILNGDTPSGQRLPSEAELSLQFAVSRSTIREALRLLSSQRLVTTGRGVTGGSFVAHLNHTDVTEMLHVSMRMLAQSRGCSLPEMLETRQLLEVTGAWYAAARRTPTQLSSLRSTIPRKLKAFSVSQIFELNRAFHHGIVDATGNRLLQLLTEPVFVVIDTIYHADDFGPAYWKMVMADHSRIMDAITARDSEAAAQQMLTHLDNLRRHLPPEYAELATGVRRGDIKMFRILAGEPEQGHGHRTQKTHSIKNKSRKVESPVKRRKRLSPALR